MKKVTLFLHKNTHYTIQCEKVTLYVHAFITNALFSTQSQCCLNFYELSFKCCLDVVQYIKASSYGDSFYIYYICVHVQTCNHSQNIETNSSFHVKSRNMGKF